MGGPPMIFGSKSHSNHGRAARATNLLLIIPEIHILEAVLFSGKDVAVGIVLSDLLRLAGGGAPRGFGGAEADRRGGIFGFYDDAQVFQRMPGGLLLGGLFIGAP